MHLSMTNWMRPEVLDQTCARLAKCGYESIELMGDPERYADLPATRSTLARHEIRCWGAVTLMFGERDLLHPEQARRAATVEYVKRCVELVADLAGQELTVVPSSVGKTIATAAPEQEWEWAVAGLREIYEHAGPRDVRLALEPINRFETYFLNRAEQAVALAEEVGEDCGVCLDTFHLNIEEPDPVGAISAVGSRLVDIHIADTNRYAPGMGHYDWDVIVAALRGIGYDGALTVEFVPNIDRTPANRYPNALDTGPVDISDDHAKFIEDHSSNFLTDEFYTWLTRASAEKLLPLIQKSAAPA